MRSPSSTCGGGHEPSLPATYSTSGAYMRISRSRSARSPDVLYWPRSHRALPGNVLGCLGGGGFRGHDPRGWSSACSRTRCDGNVRVDLGGGCGRVAEQLLDLAQARAPLQQMCSVGVPERVRRARADSRPRARRSSALRTSNGERRRPRTLSERCAVRARHARASRVEPLSRAPRAPARPGTMRSRSPCRRRAGGRPRHHRTRVPVRTPRWRADHIRPAIPGPRDRAGWGRPRFHVPSSSRPRSPAVAGSRQFALRRLRVHEDERGVPSARSPRRTRSPERRRAGRQRGARRSYGASRRAARRACQRRSRLTPAGSRAPVPAAQGTRAAHADRRAARARCPGGFAMPDAHRDEALDRGLAGDVCIDLITRPRRPCPAPF